jgi:hypothetical protein
VLKLINQVQSTAGINGEDDENNISKPGLVEYSCNPSTWEDLKLEASQEYIVRS